MSDATLLGGASLGLAGAVLLALAGWRTARRATTPEASALRAFAAFWLGAAAYAAADATWTLLHLAGLRTLPIDLAIQQAKLLSLCGSFAGLVCYLLVIFTGRPGARWLVGAGYVGLVGAWATYLGWRGPIGHHENEWSLVLDFARPQVAPVWAALVVLLLGPPLLAALGYASLLRLARDRDARRRVLLTSGSLVLFFVPEILVVLNGPTPTWRLVEHFLGLVAAAGIFAATRPARGEPDHHERARRTALDARVRELI